MEQSHPKSHFKYHILFTDNTDMPKTVVFVSGNKNKIKEVVEILGNCLPFKVQKASFIFMSPKSYTVATSPLLCMGQYQPIFLLILKYSTIHNSTIFTQV